MKQAKYTHRRGRLHRHGRPGKRPKNRPVSLRAMLRRKIKEEEQGQ